MTAGSFVTKVVGVSPYFSFEVKVCNAPPASFTSQATGTTGEVHIQMFGYVDKAQAN